MEFYLQADMKKYEGRYVAIIGDEVVASGDNAKKSLGGSEKEIPRQNSNLGENPKSRSSCFMDIEFEFRKEESKILGPVMRPMARIIFIGNIEVPEIVYVDSGADLTLIPHSVGELLGLAIDKHDEIKEIKGIGEKSVPILIKNIKIKIGEKTIDARVAWSLIEDVPILLGRLDIFNLFCISFEKEKTTQKSEMNLPFASFCLER